MRNKLRLKFILLIVCAALLILPARGAEPETVYDFASVSFDDAIADFMTAHKLTEKNFAMGWYDIESGESRYFNGDAWFCAASMYKLPLAMACYDRIAEGTLQATDSFSGWQLGVALHHAIVFSDNDAATAARHAISYNQMIYRDAIAVYSGIAPEDLPYGYYNENRISPEFMIHTLQTLWDRSEDFPELIEDLKKASPSMCFGADEGRQFEMGHKYGSFEGAVNDCAIVWADRPYLLVVFTQSASYAERTLRELYSMVEDYAVYLHAQDEAEAQRLAEEQAAAEAQRLAEEQAAAEAQRLAEEQAAEARRIAEEQAQRLAEEQAAAEAQRLAEEQAAAQRHLRIVIVLSAVGVAVVAAAVALRRKKARGKRRKISA